MQMRGEKCFHGVDAGVMFPKKKKVVVARKNSGRQVLRAQDVFVAHIFSLLTYIA